MTTNSISLRLVNQSADENNSSIVIFQKNVATGAKEVHLAWQVIDNLGIGWTHRFTYDLDVAVGAADSWGNEVGPLDSSDGQAWTVSKDSSGDQLKSTGNATSASAIDVYNGLDQGAVAALLYRSGKPIATKTGVAPGQKASFIFKPMIWVGLVSQVEEGDVLDSAIVSNINHPLSLEGIASADIVMSGGGGGKNALPFTFSLQNVRYA